LKSCCVLQNHYDDERDNIVFYKIIPDLQDQDQDRFFMVSDRSYPMTDGLRPHHCQLPPTFSGSFRGPCATFSPNLVIIDWVIFASSC